jgi:hypothetical protein
MVELPEKVLEATTGIWIRPCLEIPCHVERRLIGLMACDQAAKSDEERKVFEEDLLVQYRNPYLSSDAFVT